MFLSFVAGFLMSLLVYGSMCYLAGTFMRRVAAGRIGVVVFVLIMAALWIPSIATSFVIARAVPLAWGHAGEMIILSGLLGGLLVFFGMLLRFGEEIASGSSAEAISTDMKASTFRCGKCQAVIAHDSPSCPGCGFVFGGHERLI